MAGYFTGALGRGVSGGMLAKNQQLQANKEFEVDMENRELNKKILLGKVNDMEWGRDEYEANLGAYPAHIQNMIRAKVPFRKGWQQDWDSYVPAQDYQTADDYALTKAQEMYNIQHPQQPEQFDTVGFGKRLQALREAGYAEPQIKAQLDIEYPDYEQYVPQLNTQPMLASTSPEIPAQPANAGLFSAPQKPFEPDWSLHNSNLDQVFQDYQRGATDFETLKQRQAAWAAVNGTDTPMPNGWKSSYSDIQKQREAESFEQQLLNERRMQLLGGGSGGGGSRSSGGGSRSSGGGSRSGGGSGGSSSNGSRSMTPDATAKALALNSAERQQAGKLGFNSYAMIHAPNLVRRLMGRSDAVVKDEDGRVKGLSKKGVELRNNTNKEYQGLYAGKSSGTSSPTSFVQSWAKSNSKGSFESLLQAVAKSGNGNWDVEKVRAEYNKLKR